MYVLAVQKKTCFLVRCMMCMNPTMESKYRQETWAQILKSLRIYEEKQFWKCAQQHQRHQGTCKNCKFSASTPGFLA